MGDARSAESPSDMPETCSLGALTERLSDDWCPRMEAGVARPCHSLDLRLRPVEYMASVVKKMEL